MNQGGSVRCMVTHLARLRYFVVTFISSCILDQCSQERVPACRVVRSYVPQYLNRASTLLWFGFALFPLFFAICPLFSLFFAVFPLFFSILLLGSFVFPLSSLLIAIFPLFFPVLLLGSSVFPQLSLF
jgi:hypothetical protein